MLLIARNNEIRGVDLDQPYYHTIPTISLPQVHTPIQLEYVAKNGSLYWADQQVNEIKRSGLTLGGTKTIIDTGIKEPTGLAVDWLSGLHYIGTPNGIMITNLEGEYSLRIFDDVNVVSVALNPANGRLYWISTKEGNYAIESSAMDGSAHKTLLSDLVGTTKSLTWDREDDRLYFVNDYELYYFDLTSNKKIKLTLPTKMTISAVTVNISLYF